MCVRRSLAILTIVLGTAGVGRSQVFRSTIDLVNVTATVVDKNGDPLRGLTKADFTVLEDGKPQEVTFFSADEQPMSVAIVLDTSGSMVDKIDDARDAVVHFATGLKPDDEMWLLRFSTDVQVLSEPGDSRDRVERALNRVRAGGGTALFDAVAEGLDSVKGGRHQKKAVLLITDGNDNSSGLRQRDAIDLVVRSEVLAYGLGIGHGERGSFGHDLFDRQDRVDIDVLRKLTDPTGGRSFLLEEAHSKGVDRIDEAVQKVREELRVQYSLGYYSTNTARDGVFRRIQVKPGRPNDRVRAKSGYFAPKS